MYNWYLNTRRVNLVEQKRNATEKRFTSQDLYGQPSLVMDPTISSILVINIVPFVAQFRVLRVLHVYS